LPEEYIYAVTRIHIREQNLLNHRDLEALAAADNLAEAYSLLAAKGWDTRGNIDVESLVNAEYEKTWALITEAAGDIKSLNVFRLSRDFHNLKAAVKLLYTGEPKQNWDKYFLKYGNVSTEKIIRASEERKFHTLPKIMAAAGEEAWEVLKETGNGQLCEIVIDRATLLAIEKEAEASNSLLLKKYARFLADTSNIKAAVRCSLLGKDRAFVTKVIAPAGSLNIKDLIDAALGDEFEVSRFLENTTYAGAAMSDSPGAFERWRNDELIRLIKPQAHVNFGVEPLAAYILAREAEIGNVRLILSSKTGGLGEAVIKERLGLTYV
jgi:V/A-type H+-transporting ATPase subunit C